MAMGFRAAGFPRYSSFSDYPQFEQVCLEGLACVRPVADKPAMEQSHDWNFGSGYPPSYFSFGRLRFLRLLATARELKPHRVLEVAAGDASLSASLALDGCEVWANDLREEHLRSAVTHFRNAGQINLLPGDLFSLHASEVGKFDLIVAAEVIEHVAHTVDFLQQLRSLLRPGGSLVVTTPNGAFFRNVLPTWSQIKDFTALEALQFKPDADGHLFLLTPEELEAVAFKAGLRVTTMDLWATPAITGQAGMRLLSGRSAVWPCFQAERLSRYLPFAIRRKLTFALSVVLKHA